VGRKSKKSLRDALQAQLNKTNSQLGELNRELAAKMIQLAGQTGDTEPLQQAVQALRKAKTYYNVETAPTEAVEIQQALADTLLALGRKNQDRDALESAIEAYRSAITLASLVGDEDRRKDLKINYKLASTLLGQHRPTPSLFKVA
jgi:tetratricopeptide (TPR) repeat protein